MSRAISIAALALMLTAGCSQETQQETKEALSATGEAVKAAAEDTKENAQKVGEAVKAGLERGKEEFNEGDSDGVDDATPAPGETAGSGNSAVSADTNP